MWSVRRLGSTKPYMELTICIDIVLIDREEGGGRKRIVITL